MQREGDTQKETFCPEIGPDLFLMIEEGILSCIKCIMLIDFKKSWRSTKISTVDLRTVELVGKRAIELL